MKGGDFGAALAGGDLGVTEPGGDLRAEAGGDFWVGGDLCTDAGGDLCGDAGGDLDGDLGTGAGDVDGATTAAVSNGCSLISPAGASSLELTPLSLIAIDSLVQEWL